MQQVIPKLRYSETIFSQFEAIQAKLQGILNIEFLKG